MRIIVTITLYYITYANFATALREWENSKILVPNNHVDDHEKIKNLLNKENSYKELNNDEIMKISIIKNVLKRDKINNSYENNDDFIRNEINTLIEPSHKVEATTLKEKDTSSLKPHSPPDPNPSVLEECILGKSNENLKWIDEFGKLNYVFIESNLDMKDLKKSDLSNEFSSYYTNEVRYFPKDLFDYPSFQGLEILSLAYNNYFQLPTAILNQSIHSLLYLSLAGNKFKNLEENSPTIALPNLLQLDLRNCQLQTIWENFFTNMENLEELYLSYNNIMILHDFSFKLPSLLKLDISYNEKKEFIGDTPNRLRISEFSFAFMNNLEYLDLSHTKMELKSVTSLARLSSSIIGLSLCYTDLNFNGNKFLSNLNKIKFLDVSGNTQFNFTKNIFSGIPRIERLHARDANVRTLEWTRPMISLRSLNLKDNKIRVIDNSSFSHMLYLEDLNLEKNSIGSWYSRLFKENQNLITLNLRENTLTILSTDMIDDLLSVKFLALGKNDFECSCSLQEFMQMLFEVTKNADVHKLRDDLRNDLTDDSMIEATTLQSILFGIRSNIRPEYEVYTRVNQQYYDQVLQSIEALRNNNYKSKSLISLSEITSFASSSSSKIQTILLDYDRHNEDYQCMNVTEKERQLLLVLTEMCDNNNMNRKNYATMSKVMIMTLSTSIPSVLIVSLLLFLAYWKWWYIRYFFVLCKNSAILTFMNDDDDATKEIIERRKSNSSVVEIYLYDIFVSYSDKNRDWVLNEFIPNIEKRESINVCLHERDFQIGFGILENIVSCMDRSRCLLLVISQNFLESQWCKFEMNLAQHRLLETRREKLIMVLLEDIKKPPKILKYLMRTKTYIKWPENGSENERKMFWKRLKRSILADKWELENYGSKA